MSRAVALRRPLARTLLILFALLPPPAGALDLDYADVPLRRALRDLAEKGGLNVVVDAACPDSPVTLRLRDVDPERALDLLARANGLALRRAGGAFALHPAAAAPTCAETEVVALPTRNEAASLIPHLRSAFPRLAFSAAPGRLIVSGDLGGGERARLERALAAVDVPAAAVDFRLVLESSERGRVRDTGLAVGLDGEGKPFAGIDPAALAATDRRGSGAAAFAGRVLAGRDYSIFKGSEIPRVGGGSLLTAEIQTAAVGDALRVRLVSATPEAITLELSVDVSALLPGRTDAAVTSRRIDTTVTLAPGETRVIGGLVDADERSTRDPAFLPVRRRESSAGAIRATLWADLAP